MALKFNTYRPKRYLRSRFVEGKYLLAAEATDLELELLEQLRASVKATIGDVALEDAWKVERLSDTELLIKPGEAWFKGLPFVMRGGPDQLVSGAILTLNKVPVGVSVSDDASGLGKILTLGTTGAPNLSQTTPTDVYRIVVTAREELITEVQDEFLQNANLTESTQQKIRLVFQISIVPEAFQTESPIPYTDENSASPNFTNRIVITPSLGSGDLVSTSVITGAEIIDGRDLELTINNPDLSNPIPDSPTTRLPFANGTLIDSVGNKFYINTVTAAPVSGQVVIRVDKEYQQVDPQIIVGMPYVLEKKDVYATTNDGATDGQLHWPIATFSWDEDDGLAHESSVVDLRTSVDKLADYEAIINQKTNLTVTEGGTVSFNLPIVDWSSDITLINPHGPEQTISATALPIVEGGTLAYDLDLQSGGALEKGSLAVDVLSAGATSTLDTVSLSTVEVGNIIIDSDGVVAEILSVDQVNHTVTTNVALTGLGPASIYLDSYGPGAVKVTSIKYCLASRKGNKVYIAGLELEDGESSQIGDGLPQGILDILGAGITESSTEANYSSDIRGAVNEGFQERIGTLTDAVGDSQEDRSAFLRSNDPVTWTGTQLEFTSDIVLEIINTKDGTTTLHTVQVASSPLLIDNNESLWVEVDRTAVSENLTVYRTTVDPIPAQEQSTKDVFVLFKRVDVGLDQYLHLPLHKQVLNPNQFVRLGASGSGAGFIKATYLDPISTTLPAGVSYIADGVAVVDDDLVLFTNLAADNNRIYKVSGVGVALVWTPQRAFINGFDPDDGDSVRILSGDAFRDQLAVFDGSDFLVNDIVRHFDGVSGDFYEQSSIKTIDLINNTTDNVFTISYLGSENLIVDYSISRGALPTYKETGQLFITTDGTNATIARNNAYLGDPEVEFAVSISGGDLLLDYTMSNLGPNGVFKYSVKRWSDVGGGPTGIPNYGTGGGPVSTPAAGNPGEVQFHGMGGLLAAEAQFKWNGTAGAIELDGLELSKLRSETLDNNQIIPDQALSYAATYQFAYIDYSIERGTNRRLGTLEIKTNGATVSFVDEYSETTIIGIDFSVAIVGPNIVVSYTSTNTGQSATMKYSFRRWA